MGKRPAKGASHADRKMSYVVCDPRKQTTQRPINPGCLELDMPCEGTNKQAISIDPQICTIRNMIEVN